MLSNNVHVYIIDDDAVLTEHVSRIAAKAQFKLSSFSSVDKSLSSFSESEDTPSIILLDYHIPGSSISDNLTKLQRLNLPILIMSESIAPRIIEEVLCLGASGYIQKDEISENGLLKNIADAIEKNPNRKNDNVASLSQLLVICCKLLNTSDKAKEVVGHIEHLTDLDGHREFLSATRQKVGKICSALLCQSENNNDRADLVKKLFGEFYRILVQIQHRSELGTSHSSETEH
jgi:FixJ family two-component response regulator